LKGAEGHTPVPMPRTVRGRPDRERYLTFKNEREGGISGENCRGTNASTVLKGASTPRLSTTHNKLWGGGKKEVDRTQYKDRKKQGKRKKLLGAQQICQDRPGR